MNDILPSNIERDSTPDDEEARNDFWTITGEFIYRHHVVTRVKTVHAERTNISYSDEVHRRYQNDSYIPGCYDGKNIEDYWKVDGERE